MFAARQRAGQLAGQLQRGSRTYASEAHGHHSAAPVNESFGKGSIATVSAVFGAVLLYQFVPKNGENSSITQTISKYTSRGDDWAEINAAHTKAMEQAGYDRNLFENSSNKHTYINVSYPEAFHSHSQINIQAGQLRKLDDVVEHYRQQAAQSEEQKSKKLAERKE